MDNAFLQQPLSQAALAFSFDFMESLEGRRRQVARLPVEEQVDGFQSRAAMARIQVDLSQDIPRQLHENVPQFVV
jgi:hypothetical protein